MPTEIAIALDPARPDERTAVEAVLHRAFADYVKRLGRGGPGPYDWLDEPYAEARVAVVRDFSAIRAVLVWSFDGETLVFTVDQIAVDPDHAGRGLGTKVLNGAEAMARARGADRTALHTAEMMEHLVAFYGNRGYQVVRIAPPAHGKDPHRRVFFEKVLP